MKRGCGDSHNRGERNIGQSVHRVAILLTFVIGAMSISVAWAGTNPPLAKAECRASAAKVYTNGSPLEGVVELAKMATGASAAEWVTRLDDRLDLGQYARCVTLTVWISALDSILTMGHKSGQQVIAAAEVPGSDVPESVGPLDGGGDYPEPPGRPFPHPGNSRRPEFLKGSPRAFEPDTLRHQLPGQEQFLESDPVSNE
jgi:hypothetical protein